VLGVDRTWMVALLDALERQAIVARRPSEQDRRRNILALTGHGWEVFRQAESRYSETERDFTATLERPDSGKRCRPCSARTATPEQAPGQVFIKKRQVTHPYGVPHGPPASHEIPTGVFASMTLGSFWLGTTARVSVFQGIASLSTGLTVFGVSRLCLGVPSPEAPGAKLGSRDGGHLGSLGQI
jgi:hypothetical protein